MIAMLRGQLAHKDGEGAVIDCQGVGYGVAMSVTSLVALGDIGQTVTVFVHTYVAEDALRLYGFSSVAERRTFEVLLATSGVGPKLALTILSTLDATQLSAAVASKDRSRLTRIPGVGPKKADRLLLELQDRLGGAMSLPFDAPSIVGDVISALVHLGFGQPEAEQAAQKAHKTWPKVTDIATLTRHALQSVRPRN
jgi:Holliday junction DNA helicase RuvA